MDNYSPFLALFFFHLVNSPKAMRTKIIRLHFCCMRFELFWPIINLPEFQLYVWFLLFAARILFTCWNSYLLLWVTVLLLVCCSGEGVIIGVLINKLLGDIYGKIVGIFMLILPLQGSSSFVSEGNLAEALENHILQVNACFCTCSSFYRMFFVFLILL